MQKNGCLFLSGMIFLFLLLCPSQALEASRQGLHLWFDTLLPTLLPFCILSNLLIGTGLVGTLTCLAAPLAKLLFGISGEGTYALLIGFFCGCPMGAKAINDLVVNKHITHREGEYLLSFCNNLSPGFLMTYVVTKQLGQPKLAGVILGILYGVPLFYGMITKGRMRGSANHGGQSAIQHKEPADGEPLSLLFLDKCIFDSVLTMVKIGSYLLLCSILQAILKRLPLPSLVCACLMAAVEITGGIPAILAAAPYPVSLVILMPFCALGGLSALAQTDSVTKNAHLSMGKYVRSKCLISLLTLILSFVIFVFILYGSSGVAGR